MALKCVTDISHLGEKELESFHEGILASFIRAGEAFVKSAREQVQEHALGTYKDDTVALRNSVGYKIFLRGEQIFQNVDGKGTNFQGESKYDLVDILDKVDPSGYQLIGFAGMNYASYVEAKGYNVISYQADICVVDLTRYMEKMNLMEKGSAAQLEETFIPGLSDEDFVSGFDD